MLTKENLENLLNLEIQDDELNKEAKEAFIIENYSGLEKVAMLIKYGLYNRMYNSGRYYQTNHDGYVENYSSKVKALNGSTILNYINKLYHIIPTQNIIKELITVYKNSYNSIDEKEAILKAIIILAGWVCLDIFSAADYNRVAKEDGQMFVTLIEDLPNKLEISQSYYAQTIDSAWDTIAMLCAEHNSEKQNRSGRKSPLITLYRPMVSTILKGTEVKDLPTNVLTGLYNNFYSKLKRTCPETQFKQWKEDPHYQREREIENCDVKAKRYEVAVIVTGAASLMALGISFFKIAVLSSMPWLLPTAAVVCASSSLFSIIQCGKNTASHISDQNKSFIARLSQTIISSNLPEKYLSTSELL